MTPYISLFVSAFTSATLLPGSSEALLLYLASTGDLAGGWLWCAATLGNSLGGGVNYLLGRFCLRWREHRWFPVKARDLDRAETWFTRWGVWTLLLSWLPVVGDPLTFVAGVLRVRPLVFILLVTLGKGLRYGAVLAAVNAA